MRSKTIADFRKGKIRYLVATNVAARGLDVTGLELVVNMSPPRDDEAYVHRAGRTGRAGAHGKSWTFVTPQEHFRIRHLERKVQSNIEQLMLPTQEDFLQLQIQRELASIEACEAQIDDQLVEELLAPYHAKKIRALFKSFLQERLNQWQRLGPRAGLEWDEQMLRKSRLQPGKKKRSNPRPRPWHQKDNKRPQGRQGGHRGEGSHRSGPRKSGSGRPQRSRRA